MNMLSFTAVASLYKTSWPYRTGREVNEMNIPGFTAESALSMTGRSYRLIGRGCAGSAPLMATSGVRAALISGGSGGGLGFKCNEPELPGMCSCEGPIDSADCKAMQKNCDGPIECGWLLDYCLCKFKPLTATPIGKFPRVPTGGILTW